MSPEQIRGERALDGRSDLYALAIITFEMLSGKHPYQTSTPIGVAVRHIIDPVPRILDTQPDLPPYCQAVITRALAKNRNDRFPTATAYAQALNQAALNQITAAPYTGKFQFKRGSLRWSSGQQNRFLWAGILILLAALLLVGGNNIAPDESTQPVAAMPGPTRVIITPTASPTAPPPTPTATATIKPTQTELATAVPTQTHTPTPTATMTAVDVPMTLTASQPGQHFRPARRRLTGTGHHFTWRPRHHLGTLRQWQLALRG